MVSLRATSAPFRSSAGWGSYNAMRLPTTATPAFCEGQGIGGMVIGRTYGVTLVACGTNHG